MITWFSLTVLDHKWQTTTSMLEKHLTSRNNQENDRSHKQQPLQNRWDFDWNMFRAEWIWTPQDLTDQQLMLLDLQHRAPWTLERVKGSDPRTLRNILIVVWVTISGMAVLIVKRLFWVLYSIYTFATYLIDIFSTVRICYVLNSYTFSLLLLELGMGFPA